MAWLQVDPSGKFHISFRFAGRKYKRSLKTDCSDEANARLHRLGENIRLVESGRIELPPDADVPTFLLSDGKLAKRKQAPPQTQLSELFESYFDRIPDGSLENLTVSGMKTHQRHLERHLGVRFVVNSLTRDTLQNYVMKRAKEKGIRGRKLSPATIKKELVTFRTVWNWALAESIVSTAFPLKGVRFPKTNEKPHFQTWDEIAAQIECNSLDAAQQADLWDCLFLKREEIEDLLDFIQEVAPHPFLYPMTVAAAHNCGQTQRAEGPTP